MENQREALAAFLLDLRAIGITDKVILNAFEAVPRRSFVPVIHVNDAYAGGQMPIECGQNMASIHTVARTLAALQTGPEHRVLELGTGTGYQTALLANMALKVVSLERFRTLQDKAASRLAQLGITNAVVKLADGSVTTSDLGAHDRIIANFAFEEAPRDFIDNLAANGIMIAPIGKSGERQVLHKFTKVGVRFQVEELFEVRSQPFIPGVARAI